MRPLSMLMSFLFLLPSIATAQVVALDLNGKAPGTYYCEVKLAADGTVTAKTIPVITLDGQPTPPPDEPVKLTVRATAIKTAALKATADPNRDKTAQELAALYDEIAKRVTAGEIKGPDTIAAVAKGAADMLLSQRNSAAAWQPMRDTMTSQWTAAIQEGAKDADLAKLLEEVADGLNASVLNPQAIDLAMLLEILKIVLELLKPFL